MTEENRRRNIADELSRADQALRAADALFGLGLHADSISRAYYAAYHHLRALLLARGLEARTHAGAIHVFNIEFVRTALLPASHNRLLSGMQGTRELADYDAAVQFSEEAAREQIADARTFAADVLALLQREGLVSAP